MGTAAYALTWPPAETTLGATLVPFPEVVARALVLDGGRGLVLLAFPESNPQAARGPLYLARQLVLAAFGRLDPPDLIDDILRTFLPGFGFVSDLLEKSGFELPDLGKVLAAALGAVGDAIVTGVRLAIAAARSFVNAAIATAWALVRLSIDTALELARQATATARSFVTAAIAAAQTLVSQAIATARSFVVTAIAAAQTAVSQAIEATATLARQAIAAARSFVTAAIAAAQTAVATVADAVRAAITTGLQLVGDTLLAVTQIVRDGILGLFRQIVVLLSTVVAVVGPLIKQYVIDPMAALARNASQAVLQIVTGTASGDPESALAIAAALGALAIPFGVNAHLLALAAEHSHPLKQVGYGLFASLLVQLTPLAVLADATIGASVRAAVSRPMEYWVARRIRWRIPGGGEVAGLWKEGSISTADARLYLAYAGYSDGKIDALLDMFDEEVNLMQLRRLLDSGTIPPVWLTNMLRRLGYKGEDVGVIQTALEATQFAQQRSQLYGAAMALLRDGFSTPDRFSAQVAPLALHPRQLDLAVRAARLDYTAELVKLQLGTLRRQVTSGQISVSEFGVALAAIGLQPDRIRVEQAKATAQLAPRVAAIVAREAEAAYRDLQRARIALWAERFRRGLIDRATLELNLVAVGLDPNLARLTVEIEEAKRFEAVRIEPDRSAEEEAERVSAALQRLYVQQFRARLIDGPTLRANLVAAGLSEELAGITVASEEVRRFEVPSIEPSPEEERVARLLQDQLAGLYRDRFRAGMIDAPTYLAALIALGLDPDLARVVVERERLRLMVSPAEEEAARATA